MNHLEFFDGGAYPWYHFAQYPCGLGLEDTLPQNLRDTIERKRRESKASEQELEKNYQKSACSNFVHKVQNDTSTSIINDKTDLSCNSVALVPKQSESSSNSEESLDAHTARTQEALEKALKEQRRSDEDFSGRNITKSISKGSVKELNALTIVVANHKEGIESHGAIVRSPTKAKQMAFAVANDLTSVRSTNSSSIGANSQNDRLASEKVVVPFSVSSWRNKKKLIIPVEERLAQQVDERRSDTTNGIGDNVLDLAIAMQTASREVHEEMEEKERIKAQELERIQAEREAAEAARAKQLLEESAARLQMTNQQHETRAERLARVKLERELREQERAEKRRQALQQKAAARLHTSIDTLEADALLLQSVEGTALHTESHLAGNEEISSSSHTKEFIRNNKDNEGITTSLSLPGSNRSNYRDHNQEHSMRMNSETSSRINYNNADGNDINDENDQSWLRGRRVKGGIFAHAVISNEGIKAEMEALAELERTHGNNASSGGVVHDGIHWTNKEETTELSFFDHKNKNQINNISDVHLDQNLNTNHSERAGTSSLNLSSSSEYEDDGIARLMKRKRTRL